MTIALNNIEEFIAISGKKSMIGFIPPDNPAALVIFLYEEGKNRKNRKSNLVNQIMPKLGFAVISAEYSMSDRKAGIEARLNVIINCVGKSGYNNLTINIFVVGDGFTDLLESLVENNSNINGLILMSHSVPLNSNDLKVDLPVLIISAEEDKELNEENMLQVSKEEKFNFEIKLISNASRYYSELGKLGEAINVGGKWMLKNCLNNPEKSNKIQDSVL